MSKKEMTIGEEFENFMSFAMRYNYKKKDIRKKKKEKNLLTPSEVRDIFRQNSWSDEMLYKRLVGIGEKPDNISTKDSSPYRKRLGIRAVC